MTTRLIMSLVVIATTVWVGIDASNLRVTRGRLGGGFLDMGVVGWVFAVLLLWIVAFPCYLVARVRYKSLPAPGLVYGLPPMPTQAWAPGQVGVPSYGPPIGYNPAGPYAQAPLAAPAPVAPPVSPDGRWWWNGYQWLPMPAAPAAGPPPIRSY